MTETVCRSLQAKPYEVHVWEVELDTADPAPSCLDAAERARADRLRREDDRRRWAAARASLRGILSRYVGIGPEQLRFATGAHGKPHLRPESNRPGCCFNLSHSGSVAVVAVACAEVGIDIERIDRAVDWASLAREVFAPGELERGERTPPELWTLKEAYVKGRGLGLLLPLRSVEIVAGPEDGRYRVAIDPRFDDGTDWQLTSLCAPAGYVAALAFPHRIDRLRRFRWADGR